MSELIRNARMFAYGAHKALAHKRKYTGECYTVHLEEVAELVYYNARGCLSMVAAAYLHDSIEDSDVTIEDIYQEFGADVGELVRGMTEVTTLEDGNRKARKEIERNRLGKCCNRVKTIKLADLISNSLSIIEYDKEFAKVFMQEMKDLLEVLVGGNEELFKIASGIVDKYYSEDK